MEFDKLDLETLKSLKQTAKFYSDSSARSLLYNYIERAIQHKTVTELNERNSVDEATKSFACCAMCETLTECYVKKKCLVEDKSK